jgi:hypothetical protein
MHVKATVVFPVATKQHVVDKLSLQNTVEFSVSPSGEYTSVQYIPDEDIPAFIRSVVVNEDLKVEFDALPNYLRSLTTKQLMNHMACDNAIELQRGNLLRARALYESC